MRKMFAALLCLVFLGLFACGTPTSNSTDESTAATTIAVETTVPPQEEVPNTEQAMQPTYALTATHFYAVGGGAGEGNDVGLYYAALDDLSRVRRVPLPIHYEDTWLRELRIDRVDDHWIYLTAKAEDAYVGLRVAQDTYLSEFLGESETLPKLASPQATKPPYSEEEKALLEGNSNIQDILTLDGKRYCLESKTYVSGITEPVFYSQDENDTVVDIIENRSVGVGGELAQLGDKVLWTDSSGRVVVFCDPVSGDAFWTYDYIYRHAQSKAPRPEYEFTRSYAKTPTHIFVPRGGELYRMPLSDISQQQKVSLPKKFDAIVISGLTDEWLFVSGGHTTIDENSSYPRLLSTVTYRIPLKTLKAEQVDEREADKSPGYGLYPRYNAAGNSLLYIREHIVEALHLDTGKRDTAFDFSDYFMPQSDVSRVSGWMNTADGDVALVTRVGWWGGIGTCIVFDKGNSVHIVDEMALPRPQAPLEHTPGKAEQELENCTRDHKNNPRSDTGGGYTYVDKYVACDEYIFYLERGWTGNDAEGGNRDWCNFYRVKIDGSGKKLLRAEPDMFDLMAVNGKLCAFVGLKKSWDEGPFDFCAVDENGKVTKTIASGFSGEWGWNTWERVGDLIMFNNFSVNGSEESLHTLYAPATGAVFSTQE